MKYIFIIYLFNMLDINIILYKYIWLNVDYFDLGKNKLTYISGRREYNSSKIMKS